MVKPEQVANGVMAFAEAELLPALDGWRMWAAGAAMVLAQKNAGAIVASLANNKVVTALGLIDGSGMIDVDAAIDAMKTTARQRGKLELDIPQMGLFKLGEADFDLLKQHIMNAAP